MRIAIDCRWITIDTGGISRHTLNLVEQLSLIDENNQYFLLVDNQKTEEKITKRIHGGGNFQFIFTKYGTFSLMNQVLLPMMLERKNIQILHSPNFAIPFFGNFKKIITIHDLIPYIHPEWFPMSKKTLFFPVFKTILKQTIRRVDKIITNSLYSGRDIKQAFFCQEKVVSIYNGVESSFQPINQPLLLAKIKDKYNLSIPFILYVGRQDPSKNIVGLIKTLGQLRKKIPEISLVILGKKDERYFAPYLLLAEKFGLSDKIFFTGIIPDAELPLMYSLSSVFVFPSLYEGFGLPPLEAMACGCPVVCSNTSSLPEVVGDAGIMVDPNNVDELANAIHRVLMDSHLRKKMIEKGLERTKMFSWKKMAEETLKVYEEVLK